MTFVGGDLDTTGLGIILGKWDAISEVPLKWSLLHNRWIFFNLYVIAENGDNYEYFYTQSPSNLTVTEKLTSTIITYTTHPFIASRSEPWINLKWGRSGSILQTKAIYCLLLLLKACIKKIVSLLYRCGWSWSMGWLEKSWQGKFGAKWVCCRWPRYQHVCWNFYNDGYMGRWGLYQRIGWSRVHNGSLMVSIAHWLQVNVIWGTIY